MSIKNTILIQMVISIIEIVSIYYLFKGAYPPENRFFCCIFRKRNYLKVCLKSLISKFQKLAEIANLIVPVRPEFFFFF